MGEEVWIPMTAHSHAESWSRKNVCIRIRGGYQPRATRFRNCKPPCPWPVCQSIVSLLGFTRLTHHGSNEFMRVVNFVCFGFRIRPMHLILLRLWI
uniref:Uncharacterized protein n=1 Tax=Physcomitrium patens TaxID=3218 RepID=A0A2K1J8L2_PHYPA|nr:hypothetical protein PHYPA_020956 [Physcomitrium patens]